jgi:hypothetical protein
MIVAAEIALAMGYAAAAAAPLGAAPANADTVYDPVQLFTSACVNGEAKLASGSVKPVAFRKLPAGVKQAVSMAPVGSEPVPSLGRRRKAADVPNRIFKVRGRRDFYLLLPAAGGNAAGGLGGQCTVVWPGDHFAEADAETRAALPLAGIPSFPVARPGFGYVAYRAGASNISVVVMLLNNWTMLKSQLEPAAAE